MLRSATTGRARSTRTITKHARPVVTEAVSCVNPYPRSFIIIAVNDWTILYYEKNVYILTGLIIYTQIFVFSLRYYVCFNISHLVWVSWIDPDYPCTTVTSWPSLVIIEKFHIFIWLYTINLSHQFQSKEFWIKRPLQFNHWRIIWIYFHFPVSLPVYVITLRIDFVYYITVS